MSRLINQTIDLSTMVPDAQSDAFKNRSESRLARTLPVLLIPCGPRVDEQTPEIKIGITVDVSCFGMSVVLTEPIALDEVILLVGCPEHRKALRGICRHAHQLGLGACQYGIQLDEVLNDAEYAPIFQYGEALESNARDIVENRSNAPQQPAAATV